MTTDIKLIQSKSDIMEEIERTVKEIKQSVEVMAADIHGLKSSTDALSKAFPSGDIEGHRRYHQLMIEDIEGKKRLRQTIQEKTISGLVWLAIVSVGMALWHEILRLIGRSV